MVDRRVVGEQLADSNKNMSICTSFITFSRNIRVSKMLNRLKKWYKRNFYFQPKQLSYSWLQNSTVRCCNSYWEIKLFGEYFKFFKKQWFITQVEFEFLHDLGHAYCLGCHERYKVKTTQKDHENCLFYPENYENWLKTMKNRYNLDLDGDVWPYEEPILPLAPQISPPKQ